MGNPRRGDAAACSLASAGVSEMGTRIAASFPNAVNFRDNQKRSSKRSNAGVPGVAAFRCGGAEALAEVLH